MASPDGRIGMMLHRSTEGSFEYRITRDKQPVLDWSALGVVVSRQDAELRKVQHDFTRALRFISVDGGRICDQYVLKVGKRLTNDVCGNRVTVELEDDSHGRFAIEARAYNDGVAFRYLLRGSGTPADTTHTRLEREATTFNMAPAEQFFGQPYDKADGWRPSYETPAISAGLPAGSPVPDGLGTGWAFPMLFRAGQSWTLIHESGLLDQSFGSHVAPNVLGKTYSLAAPLAGEAMGNGDTGAYFTTPWQSPWRLFVIGDLTTIVGSNLVQTLAEPSKVADDAWVKPGIASWSWLSDHDSSKDPATLRRFVDLAAEMGWPYSLVDANWNTFPKEKLVELVDYAKSRKVGLFLWYNSGGTNNAVPEQPRNLMDDAATREAELLKIEQLGIRGIKVDFWQSDKQFMMQRYVSLLEAAARHHLLVNLHGSTVPRGWERTYPNLVSMEAVRGDEFYTFESTPDYGALAPAQNALLPFTRNAVGPMDATPMLFTPKQITRRTTAAHEAALGVIFESGVQHLSDGVEAYRGLPADWKAYLRDLPTAWDDTKLLAGEPGKFAVLARRKGNRWWVGGINGGATARDVDLDLSFLPQGTMLLTDDPQGKPGATMEVAPRRHFALRLLPFGGFVMAPK